MVTYIAVNVPLLIMCVCVWWERVSAVISIMVTNSHPRIVGSILTLALWLCQVTVSCVPGIATYIARYGPAAGFGWSGKKAITSVPSLITIT